MQNSIQKKILIITYYWPPAGGPGVQRWLKFVKYLPEFGIDPIVYIPKNPLYPILDDDLIGDVATNTKIIKHKIFEPFGIANFLSGNKSTKLSSGIIPKTNNQSFGEKIMLWIRGNLFIPDARIFWVKPSVKFLEKYILENDIKTIITTGPPHSLHLIGLRLKSKCDVKWIADFRDPWTTIGYQKQLRITSFVKTKHQKLEKNVLQSADQIIVTSPSTKKEFRPITSKPITVITNGFDHEITADISLDKKFTIAHIGSFLSERNPEILWQVLSELILVNIEFQKHFELKLVGKISREILATINNFGLTKYVNNLGYISHLESIQHQNKSQVLLLIEIDSIETRCIIPGKLFEYLSAKRPIISIGPKGSDMQQIIENTNAGFFVDYSQKDELKSQIMTLFDNFLNNNLHLKSVNIEQYSRRNLTSKLANLIKSIQ